MCGIAGIWNLDGQSVSPGILECFTNSLAHRGPDGNGFYIDAQASLGLGHRRLAIIDTSEGARQPMSFADGRYWITFNGEIYNFLELKVGLEQAGYQFITASDTEVVLAAYHQWGEDCQLRFNGMWAFAIWDRDERKLFLSRDRFGVKPLIYYFDQSHFAFASEMKAFLAIDWFQPDFDPDMIAAALSNERLIEGNERCLLRGLRHLLGGHCLTIRMGEEPAIRRWWNTLDHLEPAPRTYDDEIDRFRELFLDACRIRMRSDVPIGTALSGGLDSSAILSGMHYIRSQSGTVADRMARNWQSAFIMTYPGAAIDERKYADEVIKQTNAKPIYCVGTPNMYLEYFERILFEFEEISDIHLGPWMVYKSQRKHGIVVTIDGHGADEAMGGYPWYVTAALKDSISNVSPRRAYELVAIMKGLELFPAEQFYIKSAQSLLSKFTKRSRPPWLLQPKADFKSPGFEADKPLLQGRDSLFRTLYIDFHFIQLPSVLRNFDRLSMAHGVEVRSPFMDWRLVTFLFSLPSSSKIGSRFTKRILRDSLKGILPEPIRRRTQKLGFPNLTEALALPSVQEFILDTVHSREFQQSAIWDGKRIEQDLAMALRNQNHQQIQKAWIYVQAMYLMKLFREKRNTYFG